MHIFLSNCAMPIFNFCLRRSVSFLIASVGQTCPHRLHWYSQYPRRVSMTGAQVPPIPAPIADGWSTLVGHTFMQFPQRMHRWMNSFSGREPGGRMSEAVPDRGGLFGAFGFPGETAAKPGTDRMAAIAMVMNRL